MTVSPGNGTEYIQEITLDESSITRHSRMLDGERQVAIRDLTQWNHFSLNPPQGPYELTVMSAEGRILLTVIPAQTREPVTINVALAPFRSLIRDYFLICESYFEAVKTGNMPRTEAIDMSRRALHNEGAELLRAALNDKATLDHETARRLFTLLTVLHLK